MHEPMIIDMFAGGGGASLGIERATGRRIDVAINHNAAAIRMHQANHPETLHLQEDVRKVKPREVCAGREVGFLWASPDCTHHSKAKGGKPRKKEIRGLAWMVVRWLREVSPRVAMLENVEEFADWGPLTDDGRPCPFRKGESFQRWVRAMKALGGHIGEVRAFLTKFYGTGCGQKLDEPAATVTSKDRLGLVMVHGVEGQIVDIGLRMLRPRELARAQGFPDDYKLPGTLSEQVARIGNSVCPDMAEALVRANYVPVMAAQAAA